MLCDPGSSSSLWASGAGHFHPAVSLRAPPSACSPFALPTQECWAPVRGAEGKPTLREGWGHRETVTGGLILSVPSHIQPALFSFSGVW